MLNVFPIWKEAVQFAEEKSNREAVKVKSITGGTRLFAVIQKKNQYIRKFSKTAFKLLP